MNRLRFSILVIFLISYMLALTSCSDKSADISILSDTDVFQASSLNNKIDILWMVDSSGSMAEEQDELAASFNSFIQDFVTKGYDYNIAVAATDAWRYEYNPGSATYQNLVRFRDGNIYSSGTTDNSGIYIINNLIPDVIGTFMKNVKVGTLGSGDERAFDSIRQSLTSPINTGYNFRRDDAFLAVIIISDEEDFSRNNSASDGCTGNPLPAACQDQNLRPVSDYVSFLDTYTNSPANDRIYTVNAIGVFDVPCMNANPSSSGHMGLRYLDIVDETGGVSGSICDANFSGTLSSIAEDVGAKSSQFRLSREPIVSSIVVVINGVNIPENATNGWQYDSTNNSIKFYGTARPSQGSSIQITYDPTTLN